MTPIKSLIAATGTPLVLAFTLTACGGGPGSGAPDDASSDEFCEVLFESPTDGATADDLHEYADKIGDIGTPESIDGDAREGFEIYVDFIADISDDDVEKFADSEDPGEIFDGDEAKKVTEFFSIAITECIGDIPTELPT